MTDREKLIELLDHKVDDDWYTSEEIADHLLANGVRLETKEATSDKTSDKTSDDPMTNGDKIRAMSDKELARWLAKTQIANVCEALTIAHIPFEQPINMQEETEKECLEWLEQPVEDE